MKTTTQFRQMLNSDRMVVAPFILNALHAKIAEATGFEVVYMTGAGTAAERGFPDVGLITQTEMVQNARYIAKAVSVPVVCDADTGYGNPLNVWRTVREYEDAGVAAIHIEDQLFPKKCGFFQGKQVIPQKRRWCRRFARPWTLAPTPILRSLRAVTPMPSPDGTTPSAGAAPI